MSRIPHVLIDAGRVDRRIEDILRFVVCPAGIGTLINLAPDPGLTFTLIERTDF